MKRTRGDDNALQFLFAMPRQDFTPRDVEHYFWNGCEKKWYESHSNTYDGYRGISFSASGWRKRLARLEALGLLKRVCGYGTLYEWTTEGLMAVNLAKGDNHG
jgi:hypothetical protein